MKRISLIVYKRIKEYNRIYGKPRSNHAMSRFEVSETTLHRIAKSKSYAEYLGKTRTKKVVEPQKDQIIEALRMHKDKMDMLLNAHIVLVNRVIALEAKNEDKDSWFVKFIKRV